MIRETLGAIGIATLAELAGATIFVTGIFVACVLLRGVA